jgi:hypothetical protein
LTALDEDDTNMGVGRLEGTLERHGLFRLGSMEDQVSIAKLELVPGLTCPEGD